MLPGPTPATNRESTTVPSNRTRDAEDGSSSHITHDFHPSIYFFNIYINFYYLPFNSCTFLLFATLKGPSEPVVTDQGLSRFPWTTVPISPRLTRGDGNCSAWPLAVSQVAREPSLKKLVLTLQTEKTILMYCTPFFFKRESQFHNPSLLHFVRIVKMKEQLRDWINLSWRLRENNLDCCL